MVSFNLHYANSRIFELRPQAARRGVYRGDSRQSSRLPVFPVAGFLPGRLREARDPWKGEDNNEAKAVEAALNYRAVSKPRERSITIITDSKE